MLFNSFEFLLFLPAVFLLYWFVFYKSLKWQNALILLASYFFYGWWSWKFLGLILLSTVLDYTYGFGVASINRKKAKFYLWLSILNNLGILGIFKYFNFFIVPIQSGLDHLGFHTQPLILNMVLPLGISFFTFHGMSYVFDVYRGQQKTVTNFIDYAVFVSFFPLLVAGPIERATHLLPQIQKKRVFNYLQAVEGSRLILWGMFKKVVIADSLASIVDPIFLNYQQQTAFTLILGAIAFSFQIYGDFSGYSDIAIGTAKLFGFELLSNFKFPYFSRDLAEFWRRWHISLSSWFRDYLYIPLGGSKQGKFKSIRNTFVIFLVSGLWHGANWKFIIWGLIHACGFLPLLLLNRNRNFVTNTVAENSHLPNLREIFQMTTTFTFVTLAWIFFRSENMQSAWAFIKQIVVHSIKYPSQFLHISDQLDAFNYIIPLVLGDWYLRKNERDISFNKVLIFILFLLVLDFGIGKERSFIYFVF